MHRSITLVGDLKWKGVTGEVEDDE